MSEPHPPRDASPAGSSVLLTGASSGIGEALAWEFARHGHGLILVARDEEKLSRLAEALMRERGVAVAVIRQDLARPEAADELMRHLDARRLVTDVLVNNAGLGMYGPFAHSEITGIEQMLQVNLRALTHLTRRVLPGMLARGHGRILNVASTAAFQPGPLMAVYYATKAYVLSFSEALANELRGAGVTVTALCPGPTRSQFHARAGVTTIRLLRGGRMPAEDVARLGYAGLMRGRSVVIPGRRNRLLTIAVRLLPRDLVTAVVRAVQEAPGDSH